MIPLGDTATADEALLQTSTSHHDSAATIGPYIRHGLMQVDHGPCGCGHESGASATLHMPPPPPNIALTEWQSFWELLQPILEQAHRNDKRYQGIVMFFLFFPWLFPIWVTWIICACLLFLASVGIDAMRRLSWQSLQAQCASSDQAGQLRRSGWAVECNYEWWTGGKMGANRGFRMYQIPLTLLDATSDAPNGYLRLPLSYSSWDAYLTWTPRSLEAYESLPVGFDTMNQGVWSRFWIDWQAATRRHTWAHRLTLVLFHVTVLAVVASNVVTILEDWLFLPLLLAVVICFLAFLVASCYKSALFHQRRHMIARDYLDDFIQQGYHLEHRTVAQVNPSSCYGLDLLHYLYLFRLPNPTRDVEAGLLTKVA